MKEMEVRLESLEAMRAVCTHVLSDTPEEDAGKRIREWARSKNLIGNKDARLFGRNTHPTGKPEPHRYEFYPIYENFEDVGLSMRNFKYSALTGRTSI